MFGFGKKKKQEVVNENEAVAAEGTADKIAQVMEQLKKGERPLSNRQLEFLVRMASMYSAQIPNCEARLKEANLSASHSEIERANPELVKYCFDVVDRLEGMLKNPFIKSLHDQWSNGKNLSIKQFQVLARTVAESACQLEDVDEIRAHLSEFVGNAFENVKADPAAAGILQMLKSVTDWRSPVKRGKRIYDDQEFVKSVSEQFDRRRTLSPRQISALKRVAIAYRSKIADFDEKARELGIEIPKKDEKPE